MGTNEQKGHQKPESLSCSRRAELHWDWRQAAGTGRACRAEHVCVRPDDLNNDGQMLALWRFLPI